MHQEDILYQVIWYTGNKVAPFRQQKIPFKSISTCSTSNS